MNEKLIELEEKLIKLKSLNKEDNFLSDIGNLNLNLGLSLIKIFHDFPTLGTFTISLYKIPTSNFGENNLNTFIDIDKIIWEDPNIISSNTEFKEFREKCNKDHFVPYVNQAMLSMKDKFPNPYMDMPLCPPKEEYKEQNDAIILEYFIHNKVIINKDLTFPYKIKNINGKIETKYNNLESINLLLTENLKSLFREDNTNKDFVKQYDTTFLRFELRDTYNNYSQHFENSIKNILKEEINSYLIYWDLEENLHSKQLKNKRKI